MSSWLGFVSYQREVWPLIISSVNVLKFQNSLALLCCVDVVDYGFRMFYSVQRLQSSKFVACTLCDLWNCRLARRIDVLRLIRKISQTFW